MLALAFPHAKASIRKQYTYSFQNKSSQKQLNSNIRYNIFSFTFLTSIHFTRAGQKWSKSRIYPAGREVSNMASRSDPGCFQTSSRTHQTVQRVEGNFCWLLSYMTTNIVKLEVENCFGMGRLCCQKIFIQVDEVQSSQWIITFWCLTPTRLFRSCLIGTVNNLNATILILLEVCLWLHHPTERVQLVFVSRDYFLTFVLGLRFGKATTLF